MILATQKCGCLPKKQKPPCSPCCASRKQISIKPPIPEKPLPSIQRCDEPPPCCPTKPSDVTRFQRPSRLRSEIVEKGLPYKEIEAIINDNRLVIRTQTEPGRPEYDPPCDCNEDPRPIEPEATQLQGSTNRTVTLFPRSRQENCRLWDEANGDRSGRLNITSEHDENPNIFLLRMRKRSVKGDKRYNIDLEFKTPRPWSTKKRLEYSEKMIGGEEKRKRMEDLDERTKRRC